MLEKITDPQINTSRYWSSLFGRYLGGHEMPSIIFADFVLADVDENASIYYSV